jgi:hypothetical protein
MGELIVESNHPTSANVFLVRDPDNNWYYEVILGFRKSERALEYLWATCKCFQKVVDRASAMNAGFAQLYGSGLASEPKYRLQMMGPVMEYVDKSITFKLADPKALDFTLANPGWDPLVADIVDTHRAYVNKVLAAEY